MSLETEYRGYTIRYSENEDRWNCYEVDKKGAVTLSDMKKRIDAMHLKMRKEASVPCFEIKRREGKDTWDVGLIEAKLIDYVKPRYEGGSWTGKPQYIADHRVATVAKRPGSTRAARQEVYLSTLVPDTDEVHSAIFKANKLGHEAHLAATAFRDAVEAIPRLTLDDIQNLVEASGQRLQEGDT